MRWFLHAFSTPKTELSQMLRGAFFDLCAAAVLLLPTQNSGETDFRKKTTYKKRGENCTFKLNSSIFLPSKAAAAEFYSTYMEGKYSRNLICIFRIFTLVGCNFQLLKLFR